MKAAFWYAARYRVEARCLSPLRTGGTDGDSETVLTGLDGVCFVQGSSLAGAFRGWLEEDGERITLAEPLFGSQKGSGSLIVSDGRFDMAAQVSTRPRLRINAETGSADPGGKFDIAQVNAGADFVFELVWLGQEEAPKQLQAIEAMLAAIDAGQIRLGAQKNNGFGKVGLTVTRQFYDMRRPEDRTAWLEGTDRGQPFALPEVVPDRRVCFILTGQINGLLVKSSARLPKEERKDKQKADENKKGKDKGSYTPNLTENDVPILPGSSIKGAVRAQAERIVKSTGLADSLVANLFGDAPSAGTETGRAGRVMVEDLRLDRAQARQISRIRINRFTGGVIRQGLLTEEPLSTPVRLELSVRQGSNMEYALLLYALRDLGLGLYNLGSGGAIGRGYVNVSEIVVTGPEGRQATLRFDGEQCCQLDDPNNLVADWMQAWKEVQRT